MAYGMEFILDLHHCSIGKFNREGLKLYLKELCGLIKMERCKLEFWDYKGYPKEKAAAPIHLDGCIVVQFIKTSNVTIHTLDKVGEIMINVFSCKYFNHGKVRHHAMRFFCGDVQNEVVVKRGEQSQCQNV